MSRRRVRPVATFKDPMPRYNRNSIGGVWAGRALRIRAEAERARSPHVVDACLLAAIAADEAADRWYDAEQAGYWRDAVPAPDNREAQILLVEALHLLKEESDALG